MLNLQLVATDIDGTLARSDGQLSVLTVTVLQTLLERGVPVTLVTGLNPWPARRYVAQIGHGIRAIALNGIFLLEDEQIAPGLFLDVGVIREAVVVMVTGGYVPLVYGEDGISRYLPGPEAPTRFVEDLIASRPYQPYVAVQTLEELFAVRPAQVSVCDMEAHGTALYPLLQEAVGARAYVVLQPGARTWVEVNHPLARKDTALLALAERLGVAREEIVYFGDTLNDLVVFQALPYCVAVGNARAEIKELAWRIAPTNDEDGVARTLMEFFALETEPDSAGHG